MLMEWGSKWCISSDTSNAKDTVIMFNNNKIQVNKTMCDHDGRYVMANIEYNQEKYTLCNVYAPNQDDVKFFNSIFKVLEKNVLEHVIIGGDFNLVLDVKLDRYKSRHNNEKAAEFIKMYMAENNLNDVWHSRNPEKREYSWFKNTNSTNR